MTTDDADGQEPTECPTCGRSNFQSEVGMKAHHKIAHGESIASDPTTTLVCERCGSEYEAKQKRADESRFCGVTCRNRHINEQRDVNTEICDWCGDEFRANPDREARFCSRNCYGKWASKNRVGESHPGWNGGDFQYGPGFNDEKKQAVRERDGFRCQGCGMTEKEHRERIGRTLDVHQYYSRPPLR